MPAASSPGDPAASPADAKGAPGTKAGASARNPDDPDFGGGVASIRETGVPFLVGLAGVHSAEAGGLVLSARFSSKTGPGEGGCTGRATGEPDDGPAGDAGDKSPRGGAGVDLVSEGSTSGSSSGLEPCNAAAGLAQPPWKDADAAAAAAAAAAA